MNRLFLIVLLGLAIGAALGLTGVGAGAVLTPAPVLMRTVRPALLLALKSR